MSIASGLPDPIVTASIYCNGYLDHVIFWALKPFRDAVQSFAPDAPFFLWMIRFGKCGEHIKVRVHSKPEYREGLQNLLARHTQKLFLSLPPSSSAERNRDWPTAQIIDL